MLSEARSFGLVVRAKDSRLRGRGFESPLSRLFSCKMHLESKHGNLKEKYNLIHWNCCECCNLGNWREDIEEWVGL